MANRFIMELFSFYTFLRAFTEVMAYSESGPRNLVILAGKETKILCNAGPWILGIDWYFVDVGGSEEIKLTTRSQISSAGKDFSVSGKIPGESLSINTTEIKHAGKYICTTLERQKNRSSADVARFITQVIVLESDPECHLNASTVKERDNIEMRCIVRYSGNWSPVIEWREMNANITNEVLTESTNNSLTSTLSVAADASKHNSSYACLIYFTAHQNQTIADNVPDYSFTWTSPNVLVLYGPTEASLSPHKDFQSEGDELICSAEAYPMPRFVWTILENNATVDGPVLVIRFEMIRADSTSIQCTAINDVTAIEAKSHIVKINSGDTVNRSIIKIVPSMAAVVCAVLVFMVLMVIQKNIKEWIAKVCRRHRAVEREANEDIVPQEMNENEPSQNGIVRNQACEGIAECSFVSAEEVNDSSACRNLCRNTEVTEEKYAYVDVHVPTGDVACKYVEMNASGFKSTVVPPAGPSLFSMSIYASIDHTLKVLPPPPKERRP